MSEDKWHLGGVWRSGQWGACTVDLGGPWKRSSKWPCYDCQQSTL